MGCPATTAYSGSTMPADQYVQPAAYRTAKDIVSTTGKMSDASLNKSLKFASSRVNKACGRRFAFVDAADTTFIYLSRGGDDIWLDDYRLITSVSIEGSTCELGEDYMIDRQSSDPDFPYERIHWLKRSSVPRFNQKVTVVGRRGWAAVPETVQECVIEVCAIFRFESPRAYERTAGSSSYLIASKAADELISEMLADYTKWSRYNPHYEDTSP